MLFLAVVLVLEDSHYVEGVILVALVELFFLVFSGPRYDQERLRMRSVNVWDPEDVVHEVQNFVSVVVQDYVLFIETQLDLYHFLILKVPKLFFQAVGFEPLAEFLVVDQLEVILGD